MTRSLRDLRRKGTDEETKTGIGGTISSPGGMVELHYEVPRHHNCLPALTELAIPMRRDDGIDTSWYNVLLRRGTW